MKKKSKTKRKRSFFDLTPQERDREVARFDDEIDIERDTRPLTAKERALFERARGGKPESSIQANGEGHIIILDDELWIKATAFARKKKTTLPKVIDRALRGLLAFAES